MTELFHCEGCGIIVEGNPPYCEQCALAEALLNQYRETIIKYFYNGEIDFRHWSDLLYQLREIDPVLEDMFTDPERIENE